METPDPKIFFALPAVHAPVQAVELDDSQVCEALNYWIEQLGLHDWAIDFERTRGYNMGSTMGNCRMTFSKQRATIRMLYASDKDPECDPIDEELTLVHELLHVRLAAIHCRDWDERPDATEYQFCVEHPVHRLSCTLVDLRRQGAHRFSWEPDPHKAELERLTARLTAERDRLRDRIRATSE